MQVNPFIISAPLKILTDNIISSNGKPILVGGCVRDHLLDINIKDIDIEVYNISLVKLEQALSKIAKVHAVGKSFGVLKVLLPYNNENYEFDVSLPRTENKQGQGHKGFLITPDENLDFARAAQRRDFTINAIGYDIINEKYLDPYNGIDDLKNKKLKHVSDKFSEDPLRVLRAAQFAARFSLNVAGETINQCLLLKSELLTLPKERINAEIKKLILAAKPSLGFDLLLKCEALETLFSELYLLVGCEQEKLWHPEGDVWIHTLMVIDQAARLIRKHNLNEDESLIIMLGALCHDLGKPATTKLEEGLLRSKGHEQAGALPCRMLLEKMGFSFNIIEQVVPLVVDHLKPCQLYKVKDSLADSAIRRLAQRVSIEKLCFVAEADFLGRTTSEALAGFDPSVTWLRQKAEELKVKQNAPKAILQGRDLIRLGIKPGPRMGNILKQAFEAQLEGEFDDLKHALIWIKKLLQNS